MLLMKIQKQMYLLELNTTNAAQNFGLLIEAIFQNSSAS